MTIAKIRSALLSSVSQTNLAAAQKAAGTIETTVQQTIGDLPLILENTGFEDQELYDREWTLQMLFKSFPHISSTAVTDVLGKMLRKKQRTPDRPLAVKREKQEMSS